LKNASEVPTITPGTEESLFQADGPAINHITLQRVEDSKTLELQQENSVWKLIQPATESTDSAAVESAVTSLLSARIVAKPSGATDLVILGLNPPVYRVLVSLENGQQVTINVGKAAGTGTGYYVLTNARQVYIVNKFGLDSLIHMVDYPPILPTPTPAPETTPEPTEVMQPVTPTP
jgi:hypothetical protein